MNRKIRRYLSLFLCLIMIFSLTQNVMSTSAFEDKSEEVTEEIINQQEYKDAVFKVMYKDIFPEDINDIIEIYSGKNKINDLQIISEKQASQNDLKVYQYTIKNLPVYNDDLTSKNNYIIKLKDKISYQMIDDSSFDNELSLIENEDVYTSKEIIGVYLSTYNVEGTIQWDNKDHPSIEDYFKSYFKVLLNNTEYDAKIEYSEENNIWKYKITNLYVLDKDNKEVNYVIDNDIEGYDVNQQKIVINKDNSNLAFKYTKIEAKKAKEQVKKPKVKTFELKDEEIETHTIKYNEQASIQLHWQDATQITHTNPNFVLKDATHNIVMKLNYNELDKKYDVSYEFGDNVLEEIRNIFHSSNTPNVAITGENSLNQTVTISHLISQIDETSFDWQISEIDAEGYIPQINDNNTAILTRIINFKADVIIKNGGKALSQKELTSLIDGLIVSVKIGDQTITKPLQEIAKEIKTVYPNANITYEYKDNKLIIKGLPQFSNDINSHKQELVYSLKQEESHDDSDYYTAIYDNKNASNFSSVIDKCHNGGKITLIKKGITEYKGTKIWLDEGQSTRPSTKWTLWRYSLKEGASFKTASPVYDSRGQKIEWDHIEDIELNDHGQYSQEYSTIKNLPKYDNDGYEYVYFVKETMSDTDTSKVDEYVKHFGTADKDFKDDQLPTSKSREDDDTSLYNGGTLTNRHEKKVNKTVEKKWIAAEYQSNINDVEVELTLQSRVMGKDEWKVAEDQDGKPIVRTMKGFKTESMSMKESVTVEGYNIYGEKLEYKWVETAVRENGENKLKDNQFTLSMNDNGKCPFDEEHFQVITETVDDKTTITNQLVGNTCYQVKKIWNTDHISSSINITLEQRSTDGSLVGKYVYTMSQGESDTEKEWNMHITEYPEGAKNLAGKSVSGVLPKYDENGAKYSYYITEEHNNNWYAEYEYEVSNYHYGINNVVITNNPAGEGKLIKVRKVWLDDGDAQTRGNVNVAVYRVKVENETEDKYLGQVNLSASRNWWRYFDVTEYIHDGKIIDKKDRVEEDQVYRDGQYYLKEVSIKDSNSNIVYNVDNNIVTTNKHKYEVSYPMIGDVHYEEGYYTVVNRRIGHVNLSVTKQWIDGHKNNETREDYNARIVLQKNGEDTNQQVYLTGEEIQEIKFENLDKYDELGHFIHYSIVEYSGDEDSHSNKVLEDADYMTSIEYSEYKVEQDSATSHDLQEIKVENKESKTKDVVFYKQWIDQAVFIAGNRPDIYLELYYVDSNHPTPTPLYKDHIWKFSSETNDEDHNIYTKLDGDYYWSCKFSNLPKYDEQGKEIIYYAREGLLTQSSDLDYIGVQYIYKNEEDSTIKSYADISYENGEYIVTNVPKENDNNVLDAKEDGTVLREGGTFVNQLRNIVTINGKKIWENIPKGYPSSQLPKVSFKLYQNKDNIQSEEPIAYIDDVSSENTDFRFTFKYVEANSMNGESLNETHQVDISEDVWTKLLPKYDLTTGEIYTYSVKEEITNTSTEDGLELITDTINNNYQIKNTYNIDNENKSNITVKKTWTNYTGHSKPETQYTLYRFFKNIEGTYSSPQAIETKYLASNGESLTFDDLLIYAPNGNKFIYYVVEKAVNGYTTTSILSDNDNIDKIEISDESELDSQIPKDDLFILKYKRTHILENIISLFKTTPDITFTNDYDNADSTSIDVQKRWNDIEGLNNRLENVYLALYRYAEKQASQTDIDNSISKELMGIIKLNADSSNNQFYGVQDINNQAGMISCTRNGAWQTIIDSLDKYAPNGNNWIYTIKEVYFEDFEDHIDSNYNFVGEVNESSKIPYYNPTYSNASLTVTNHLKTVNITAIKQWHNVNQDIQKPTVVFRLQVKDLSSGSWQWASDYFKNKCGEDEWTHPTNQIIQKLKDSLGNFGEIKVNYNTNYKAIFKNLPKYADKSELEYRVMEVMIGDKDIEFDSNLDYADHQMNLPQIEGVDDPYITIENSENHTITNTLQKVTSLTIQKVWDDQDNIYNTRGGSDYKHWKIRYKIYCQIDGEIPKPVKDLNGNDYIVSIDQSTPSADGVYLKTIENLPMYNLDGQKYLYFAKELTHNNVIDYDNISESTIYTDNDGQVFTGNMKYNGGYDVDYENTINNNDTYITKVTNTLETTDLSVTKDWLDNNDQYGIRSEVMLTLRRKINNGNYADVKTYTIVDGQVHSNDVTTTLHENNWTYTFNNLPKYDPNGHEYTYSVREKMLVVILQ